MKNEIVINLKKSVNVPRGGELESCSAITIYSPTAKQISEICVLENAVGKAQMAMMNTEVFKNAYENRDTAKAESAEMSADAIIAIISSATDSDVYQRCFDALKNLLTSGKKASFDGFDATKAVFDDLSIQDMKTILGEYIVNFIIPSQGQEKTKE